MLFTPRSYSALPGLAMPGDPKGHPTKDEMADYLASYAEHFKLPIRLQSQVTRLERTDDRLRVRTADAVVEARQVVIAASAYQVPAMPSVADHFSPEVCQLTTSSYKNAAEVP